MNKKGSIIADMILLVVIIFALSLFIIVGYKVMTEINTNFQNNPDLSTNAKSNINDLKGKFVNLFDGIFITTLIFLILALAVGAYYLNLHPVFYIPAILIIVFVVIMAAIMANTFSDITDDNLISTTTSEFTILPFIMDYYVYFILVFSFLIIIALYAKQRMIA